MAQYYLPEGTWTNMLTGEIAEGGCWRREHHDYCSIPVWARQNSIIAFGKKANDANYGFENNLEFHVFGLKSRAETMVYQNQKIIAKVFLELDDDGSIHGFYEGAQSADVVIGDCRFTVQTGEFRTDRFGNI